MKTSRWMLNDENLGQINVDGVLLVSGRFEGLQVNTSFPLDLCVISSNRSRLLLCWTGASHPATNWLLEYQQPSASAVRPFNPPLLPLLNFCVISNNNRSSVVSRDSPLLFQSTISHSIRLRSYPKVRLSYPFLFRAYQSAPSKHLFPVGLVRHIKQRIEIASLLDRCVTFGNKLASGISAAFRICCATLQSTITSFVGLVRHIKQQSKLASIKRLSAPLVRFERFGETLVEPRISKLKHLVSCVATPRASLEDHISGCMNGVHVSRHTAPYMSARMRRLQVQRHLMLRHVKLHVLISSTVTCRASVDTQHRR
ncbi:hypothetical protein F2Q69_00015444 [Brassica cretica]|uniref:Uncharacterized protein n=1 Tax=Brassica cretica TaxID=69181 RepID=A0A8S9QR32_BRACR|nr:hypothetical protein F2Q69_00015444 [Brassica cretica]